MMYKAKFEIVSDKEINSLKLGFLFTLDKDNNQTSFEKVYGIKRITQLESQITIIEAGSQMLHILDKPQ